jgi:hypothetical protein
VTPATRDRLKNVIVLSRRSLLGGALGGLACAPRRADAAAPADVMGWGRTRWGMSEADLRAMLAGRLESVEGAFQFFDVVVPVAIMHWPIAGRPFMVLFQCDPVERRLRQVLLRYRASRPTHSDFVAVAEEVSRDLGPAEVSRSEQDYSGNFPSFNVERRWRFSTTSIRLYYSDPNAEARARVRKDMTLRYYPTRAAT